MPCSIDVISDDGGCFPLTLAAVEGNVIYGYGDREMVRKDLDLEARLRDDRGEGWDIRFNIGKHVRGKHVYRYEHDHTCRGDKCGHHLQRSVVLGHERGNV